MVEAREALRVGHQISNSRTNNAFMESNGRSETARKQKQMASDFKEVIGTAEEVLRTAAGEINRESEEIKQRLGAAIDAAREAYEVISEKVAEGARTADRVIRQNPYPTIAAALGFGIWIGFLVKRK